MKVEILKLQKGDLIASGTQRRVYMHPHDPTRIVKVLRAKVKTKGRSGLATWAERHFAFYRQRWTRKEYAEYLRLMLSFAGEPINPPIAHMYGFAMTSEGLGCLTDAVLEGEGLGPTLKQKVETDTLTSDDLGLFNDTIRRLYQYDIRVGDMTPSNFVFGHRNLAGTPGPRECVLVDGFGDIFAIPIRSWARFFNELGLDDSCKRLAARTGLAWTPVTKQFSFNSEA